MEKFFKERETKKLKLSEYLKLGESEFKYLLCDKMCRESRTRYIMEIIGDVEFDEETYKLFLSEFQRYGGRYDVRTKKETIKGIYDISEQYSFLAVDALEKIWSRYISDQFAEYALDKTLAKFVEIYGKTDKAISLYIEYVDVTAKEVDKRFVIEAAKLDKYIDDYGYKLISHLQYIIKSQHILAEEIIRFLPSKELIDKDQEHLRKITEEARIYFGACYPISYQMIESLATGEGLERYPEQPKYLICGSKTVDTTFTKQDFLDSIKEKSDSKEKQKVLKR